MYCPLDTLDLTLPLKVIQKLSYLNLVLTKFTIKWKKILESGKLLLNSLKLSERNTFSRRKRVGWWGGRVKHIGRVPNFTA